MVKKFVSVFVILSVIIGMTIYFPANAEELQSGEDHVFSSKIDPEAEFTDDCIIVVLKHDYGVVNVNIKPGFFPEISDNIEEIEDLFYIENPEDILSNFEYLDRYRQILCVHLIEHGREKVLEAIESLDGRKDIEDVSPNYIMEASPCVSPTNDYYNYLETKGAYDRIQLPAAWNIVYNKLGDVGSSDVKVAVIDGEVMPHPDLDGNLLTGYDAYHNNYITDDLLHSEGYFSHGTAVASLIGAEANSVYIPGTNWHISIVPIQAFNYNVNEWVSTSIVFAKALNYLNTHNIMLTNMSWTVRYTDLTRKLINNYRGLLIVSAGNDGKNIDSSSSPYPSYPSNYNCPNLISVGNTTNNDLIYWASQDDGSNYGAVSVDLFAPGTNLAALYASWENNAVDYDICYATGTSFSAPMVTGVAALIKAYNPDLSPLDIKRLILDNVDTVSGLSGKCVTGGRLNAYKALYAASQVQTQKPYRFVGNTNEDFHEDIVEVRQLGNGGNFEIITYAAQQGGSFKCFTPNVVNSDEIRFYRTVTDFEYNPNYDVIVLAGDVNGAESLVVDGVTRSIHYLDIVFVYANPNNANKRNITVHYGFTTNSSEYGTEKGCRFAKQVTTQTNNSHNLSTYPTMFFVGDSNGDGRDDLLAMYKNGSSERSILTYTAKSGKNGFNLPSGPTVTDRLFVASDPVFMGDFNGDGKDDFVIHWTNSSTGNRVLTTLLATGSGNYESHGHNASTTNSTDPVYKSQYIISDVQGDGYDDFVVLYKAPSGSFNQLVYSGQNDSNNPINNVGGSHTQGVAFYTPISLHKGKVNNDMYEDLICEYANASGKRAFVTFYGTSTGSYTKGIYNSSNSASTTLFDTDMLVGRFNADSYTDAVAVWTRKTSTPKDTNFIHYQSRGTSITSSSATPFISYWTGSLDVPFYSYY